MVWYKSRPGRDGPQGRQGGARSLDGFPFEFRLYISMRKGTMIATTPVNNTTSMNRLYRVL